MCASSMLSVEDYEDASLSRNQGFSNTSQPTHSSSVLDYILSKDPSAPPHHPSPPPVDHHHQPPPPPPNYQDLYNDLTNIQTLLRDTINSWRLINITEIQNQFHDHVIDITEKREEYLKKRKLLASIVRQYTQVALHENTTLTIPEIQQQSLQIIEQFKTDFDFLSTMCKQTEKSYLELYKILRDAPDPVIALSDSSVLSYQMITTLQTTENILKKLTQEISKKDQEIIELRQHQQQQLSSSSSSNRLSQVFDEKIYQEKLQIERHEIKSNYENDFKKREQILRDSLEKKYYQLIADSDQIIAQKESENQQLNDSLSELKQFVLQSQEEHELYLREAERRQKIEIKLQNLTVEMSEITEEKETLLSQILLLENQIQSLQRISKEEKILLESRIQSCVDDLQKVGDEKKELENQIARCPPIDFDKFLNTLGLSFDDQIPAAGLSATATAQATVFRESTEKFPSWSTIETSLQGVIRKYQQIISELQTERNAYLIQEKLIEEENKIMKDQINQSNETILKLERDLSDAYSSIEAGKALLKCHTIINEKNRMDISPDSPVVSSASNNNNTILQGLLSQRDRMMKLARGKESEVNSLQIQLKDLQKNLTLLQQENLSLYQRIRTVRIESTTSPSSTRDKSKSSHKSQGSSKNEEARVDPESNGDDIEEKYHELYESNLDLSHLLLYDYDKQILLSQLNPVEKSFISLIQFLIHDSFRRHSFILCLLLMSFVVFYDLAMIIVLPQMDEYSEGLGLSSELQNEEEWETAHLDNFAA